MDESAFKRGFRASTSGTATAWVLGVCTTAGGTLGYWLAPENATGRGLGLHAGIGAVLCVALMFLIVMIVCMFRARVLQRDEARSERDSLQGALLKARSQRPMSTLEIAVAQSDAANSNRRQRDKQGS